MPTVFEMVDRVLAMGGGPLRLTMCPADFAELRKEARTYLEPYTRRALLIEGRMGQLSNGTEVAIAKDLNPGYFWIDGTVYGPEVVEPPLVRVPRFEREEVV